MNEQQEEDQQEQYQQEEDIACDLIMGFSFDLLIDLMNLSGDIIAINRESIETISSQNRYAFHLYFPASDDGVFVALPHAINVAGEQQIEAVASGRVSMRDGSVTYVLKLKHHYAVNYVMPDSTDKNAFIDFRYDGTDINIAEGGVIDSIPMKMVRQAIQSAMKSYSVPSIELSYPEIDIPFADTAVDFKRLRIFSKNQRCEKEELCFNVKLNGQIFSLDGFDNYSSNVFDINRTFMIKRNDAPLSLTILGKSIDIETATSRSLGGAVNVHSSYDEDMKYSAIGQNSESEIEMRNKLAEVKVRHVYNSVHPLISPLLERFGTTLKSCDEVADVVKNHINKSFEGKRPNYVVVYGIREVKPPSIAVKCLGLLLEAETNSFSLRFNYAIDGTEEKVSRMTNASGFVYPYGLGLMVSENLLNKIYQAYWNYSSVIPKNFSLGHKDFSELKYEDVNWFNSLKIKLSEMVVDKSQLQISTLVESGDGICERGERTETGLDTDATAVVISNSDFAKMSKRGVAIADVNVSDSGDVELRIGKMEFDKDAGPLTVQANTPSLIFNKVVNLFNDTSVKLLKAPDLFTVEGQDYKISYNSVNVGSDEVIIGSKLGGVKRSVTSSKPSSSRLKRMPDVNKVVPKDKWGYEGIGKGQFNIPCGIVVKKLYGASPVFVVDRDNNRVQKFDSKGRFLHTWGSAGSDDGQFNYPNGLAIDEYGNVYVTDAWNNRVQKFDIEGTFVAKFASKGTENGKLLFPQGIAVDKKGFIFVSDSKHIIQKFKPDFKFAKKWGGYGSTNGKFLSPRGLAISEDEYLYVADAGNHRIQKFNINGKFLMKWGTEGSGEGELFYPQALAIDAEGNLFVSDTGNNRIQKFDQNGNFVSSFSCEGMCNGQLAGPSGIAVDESGNIFVSDSFNNRIQKFGT